MTAPVIVFASFKPRKGAARAFLDTMAPMIEATRLEPGNDTYDLYADGEGGFHLFERYADADALQAHRDSDHYRAYRAAALDLLEGGVGVKVLTEEDVAD